MAFGLSMCACRRRRPDVLVVSSKLISFGGYEFQSLGSVLPKVYMSVLLCKVELKVCCDETGIICKAFWRDDKPCPKALK